MVRVVCATLGGVASPLFATANSTAATGGLTYARCSVLTCGGFERHVPPPAMLKPAGKKASRSRRIWLKYIEHGAGNGQFDKPGLFMECRIS